MPLASSDMPSNTGTSSIVFDSKMFCRHVDWRLVTTLRGEYEKFEGLASGSDTVTVELETPFLFVVHLVEGRKE